MNYSHKKTLVDSLLNDQLYHIEFNGHLTNHNKHAVIALNGLDASEERIQFYYENYAKQTPYGYPLEKSKPSKYVITKNNWKNYLGKRTSFSSYCDFFDRQEKKLGTKQLLKKYLPALLPGWAGALMHATIHLGWALDVNHRWMIIEGLAYMAFSSVSCHPERAASSNTHSAKTALESLLFIAETWEKDFEEMQNWVESLILGSDNAMMHPELIRSGLQYKVAQLLTHGHPLIYNSFMWIENENDLHSIWKQLDYVSTLLYMVYQGDFLILHLITSLHAMKQIANSLPIQQQKAVARCFWLGMLCILFSRGEFAKKTVLEKLNVMYQNAIDSENELDAWTETIKRAISEEEEHNPKLVYVLLCMWKDSGNYSIFRIAATFFTTTPDLPKSFETAPTEEF